LEAGSKDDETAESATLIASYPGVTCAMHAAAGVLLLLLLLLYGPIAAALGSALLGDRRIWCCATFAHHMKLRSAIESQPLSSNMAAGRP
jgi:hypothetical protein